MGKTVSILAKAIDQMVADVAESSAIPKRYGARFLKEYESNKAEWREEVRAAFEIRQRVRSTLSGDADLIRSAVYDVMSKYVDDERRRESFEAYADFVAQNCPDDEPVDPEDFFRISPERRTGSGLPAQFGRHRSPTTRGRRLGSDGPVSICGFFEHLRLHRIQVGSRVLSSIDFKTQMTVSRINSQCRIFFEGEVSTIGHDPRDYSPIGA